MIIICLIIYYKGIKEFYSKAGRFWGGVPSSGLG